MVHLYFSCENFMRSFHKESVIVELPIGRSMAEITNASGWEPRHCEFNSSAR